MIPTRGYYLLFITVVLFVAMMYARILDAYHVIGSMEATAGYLMGASIAVLIIGICIAEKRVIST